MESARILVPSISVAAVPPFLLAGCPKPISLAQALFPIAKSPRFCSGLESRTRKAILQPRCAGKAGRRPQRVRISSDQVNCRSANSCADGRDGALHAVVQRSETAAEVSGVHHLMMRG